MNRREDESSQQPDHLPSAIDRRDFFRGAAALTVGGLGAATAPTQLAGQPAAAPDRAGAAEQLEAQTQSAMRWIGRDPADWVRPRAGVDHNVAIIGGGQSGLSIAYGLKRKGVGRVSVIDRAAPGEAGIWRTIARMPQLRTPKTMAGPELGNPALSFRAWYETLNGTTSFDALDRIPRTAWADYLDWFQETTGTMVRYGTRLIEIEPQGDLLRLHLEVDGARRVETARKVVLANGYAGAGGPNVPEFIRALPTNLWTHTTGNIPFAAMAGKIVGIVGAGSSAFDAATVALESGASEVHMFSRRAYVDYPAAPSPQAAPAPERGYPNMLELSYELPDVVRWRAFLLGDRRVASVPLDSIERAAAFDNFRLHLNSSLSDVAAASWKVTGKVGSNSFRFDHLVAATGYRIDLAAQPELARIHEAVALWGDRYRPGAGEDSAAGAAHPYLGPAFEFLPRREAGAEYLRNIHCFNLAAALSYGIPVGDVPSVVDQPRLVTAIARDLYLESVDVAAHERFINFPLTAPSAAPYERAIATREVA
jgi:cation diffusion facilitator CzcD-associated flavoprotein CzcO